MSDYGSNKLKNILISSLEFLCGDYLNILLLSQNGLFIFNNPLLYIKIGINDSQSLLNINANLLIVKNLTVLLGLFTNIQIYGVTLIAGTIADRFSINSNSNFDDSQLIFKSNDNDDGNLFYDGLKFKFNKDIYINDNKILFYTSGDCIDITNEGVISVLDNSVGNNKLINNSITIGETSILLGGNSKINIDTDTLGDYVLNITANNGITQTGNKGHGWLANLELTGQALKFHLLNTEGFVFRDEVLGIITKNIEGLSNRISISLEENLITFDIDSDYVGQTSITTLGKITTGEWQANIVDVSYGGTGKSNWNINQLVYADTTTSFSQLGYGNQGQILKSNGNNNLLSWLDGSKLTTVNDYNININLDNNDNKSLLLNLTITILWENLLSILRGGTNNDSFELNRLVYYNGTSITNTIAYYSDNKFGFGITEPELMLSVNGNIYLYDLTLDSIIYSNKNLILNSNEGNILLNTDTILNSDKSFSTPQFHSGIFGSGFNLWRNDLNLYSLLLDNLSVRGTLYASVFQKDVVRASNGYLFISDADLIVQTTNVYNNQITTIYVKDGYFQQNDILLYKGDNSLGGNLFIQAIYFIVLSESELCYIDLNGEESQLGVLCHKIEVMPYNTGLIKTSNTLVRIGNTTSGVRGGSIYFDASSLNAPFMDVYDGVNSIQQFKSYDKLKARLGNLNEITDIDFGGKLSGYGLYATDNVYIKGVINAIAGGKIANWDIELNAIVGNNIELNTDFIKLGNSITLHNTGLFNFTVDLNNYIQNKDNQFLIKTNKFLLESLNLRLSSVGLYIQFGNSVFIGKNLNIIPTELDGKLQATDLDVFLLFESEPATAYDYSDYKLLIGELNSNHLLYDGKNVTLTGKITATSGKIANFDIKLNNISTGEYDTVNTLYFGDSGLSISDSFKVDNTGTLTATSGKIANWDIELDKLSSDGTIISSNDSLYQIDFPDATEDINVNLFDQNNYHIIQQEGQSERTTIITYCRTDYSYTDLAGNVSFVYKLYRKIEDPDGRLLYINLNSATYLEIFTSSSDNLEGLYTTNNFKQYRLLPGQLNKFNIFYHFLSQNNEYIYFRIVAKGAVPYDSESYDILQIHNHILLQQYTTVSLLSKSGLFIFNNPSNYIKLGNFNGSQTSLFRGSSIEVKDLTVYLNLYHYGQTFAAASDLFGTSANRFVINTLFDNGGSELRLNDNLSSFVMEYNNGNGLRFSHIPKILQSENYISVSLLGHTHSYDNYSNWKLKVNNGDTVNINSNNTVALVESGATTITRNDKRVTISSTNTTYSAGSGITLTGTTFSHTSHTGDVTGDTLLTIGQSVVTNAMLAGYILNSKLSNSSITIGSTTFELGDDDKTILLSTDTSGNFVNSILAGDGISIDGEIGNNYIPTISHLSVTTTTGTSTDSMLVGELSYNDRGHITKYKTVDLYNLISAEYPITLSAGGLFGLSYNSTNLKVTDNKLNTIQNINTTALPLFKSLKLKSGTITGNLSVDTNGVFNMNNKLNIKDLFKITNSSGKGILQTVQANGNVVFSIVQN